MTYKVTFSRPPPPAALERLAAWWAEGLIQGGAQPDKSLDVRGKPWSRTEGTPHAEPR